MALDLGELVGNLRMDVDPLVRSMRGAINTVAKGAAEIKSQTSGLDAKVKVKVDVDDSQLNKLRTHMVTFRDDSKHDLAVLGGSISGIMTVAGAAGPAILAVGSALSAAAAGGVGVASALGPAAAGGLAVYAGGFVAIKSAGLLTKFAMDGVAEAAAGDEKAMAKLSPAGRELATTLKDLTPELEGIRSRVQAGMFPGFQSAISLLAGDYLPMLDKAAGETGGVLGGLAIKAAQVADSPTFKANFGTIAHGNAETLRSMGGASIYLGDAAVALFASAQPLINTFFRWAEGAAKAVDETVQAGAESGRLAAFWETAGDRGATLGRILGNLGGALADVFHIGASDGAGGQMLHTLEDVTAELEKWTGSAEGAASIAHWFDQGQQNLGAMSRLLGAVSGGLSDIGSGAQFAPLIDQITKEVIPPMQEFLGNASASGALGKLVTAVGEVIQVFADLSENDSSLYAFADTLGFFAKKAQWIIENVPGAGKALGIFFTIAGAAGALKLVGLGPLIGLIGNVGKAAVAAGWQMLAGWAMGEEAADAGVFAQGRAVAAWIVGWVKVAAVSVLNGAKVAGAWLLSSGVAMATAIASTAVAVAGVVAGWVVMGAQSLIQAGRMAAAWLIAMGPIGIAIAAVVGVGIIIYKNWDNIVKWTGAAWDWVVDKVRAIPGKLVSFFTNFTLPGLILSHWDTIRAGARAAWDWLVDKVRAIPGKLVSFFMNYTLPGLVISHFQAMKEGAIDKAQALVSWVAGLPGKILDKLASLAGDLAQKGREGFNRMKEGAQDKAGDLLAWVDSVPGKIRDKIGDVSGLLSEKGRNVIQGMRDGVGDKWGDFSGYLNGIPGRVGDAVGNLGGVLHSAGAAIVQGLINGLVERFGALKAKVQEITNWVKDHKGPRSLDLVLWRPAGQWIMSGLMDGLDDQMPALARKVTDVTDSIAAADMPALASASAGAPAVPMSAEVARYAAGQGGAANGSRVENNWNIYETTNPQATAAEVSRRQAFAGAGA